MVPIRPSSLASFGLSEAKASVGGIAHSPVLDSLPRITRIDRDLSEVCINAVFKHVPLLGY